MSLARHGVTNLEALRVHCHSTGTVPPAGALPLSNVCTQPVEGDLALVGKVFCHTRGKARQER